MAAAVELAEHGVPVMVFESARILGGRARRVEVNGVALDNGLHILIGAYHEALRLIAKVSGAPDAGLLRQPLDLHVLGRFRLRAPALPAPFHLAVALLRAQGMGLGERVRAARFITQLRAARFTLYRDITVAELLERFHQTGAAARHLWESLCTSALNTPPQRASAQVFLNILRDTLDGPRQNSELLLPTVNFSALFPEPAAVYVQRHGGRVLTGISVSRVVADGAQLVVHTSAGAQTFSRVVCALPPYRVPEVLAQLPEIAVSVQAAGRLRYEPIYSVFLQYPGTVQLPQPMVGIDGGVAQWLFDRGALCGQRGLIGVVISASGRHQELEQKALAIAVHRELHTHIPKLPKPLWAQVIAEKRATFSCVVGVERPANRTAMQNLYLAGDYTASDYPATLESAVRSGVACARMILEDGPHA
jgi:squalene-associated FAD-dependent desaturase